jgi:hypothetical protein
MIDDRLNIAAVLDEDGHLVGVLTDSDPSCAFRGGLADISVEHLKQALRSMPLEISYADLGVDAAVGLSCPGDSRHHTTPITNE